MATNPQGQIGPGRSEASSKMPEGTRTNGRVPESFDPEYVAGAVAPFLQASTYVGERPSLPMIDLTLSKEKAVGAHIWGLIYDGWEPDPEEEGVSVFLRGYDQRGPHNERKRIYVSAVTPDLVETRYRGKLTQFFDKLMAADNAGKPLMSQFYASFLDMYWDLHVGVHGAAIPAEVRDFSTSFNAVFGYALPTTEVVYENYMRARATRPTLKEWVDDRVQAIIDGEIPDADRTLVYYWLKNGELGENFRRKDIVFECFHNLLAFSQWGKMTYQVMGRLEPIHGDPATRAWYERTMSNGPDDAAGAPFTPLDRFVMELFRTIMPNPGSGSAAVVRRQVPSAGTGLIQTPHGPTSMDPRHWTNPEEFDPDRFQTAPTSADNDEAKAKAAGLARCPFAKESFTVKDGRNGEIANSAYGAVYGVIDGTPYPVCDTAGYAPFGFGYRRCAGELLTVDFIKELLRKAWADRLSFVKLNLESPERLPVGPGTVIEDDISFERAT